MAVALPGVLVFDEPTRGIDVGAKAEIYQLMRGLPAGGTAIVMISSDMEEILANSDRVAVMHEGRVTGILERSECTAEASCSWRWRDGPGLGRKELSVLLLLVALCVVVAFASPQFLSAANIQNMAG